MEWNVSYRLLPNVHLVLVKTQTGQVDYHYSVPVHNARGPIIPWLNDQQREQFLSEDLVERIEDNLDESSNADSDPADAVESCVAALDTLGVPADAGAPTARAALRDRSFRFENSTIAAAVRVRKRDASLSGTPKE